MVKRLSRASWRYTNIHEAWEQEEKEEDLN
jgi:hypothetical protein